MNIDGITPKNTFLNLASAKKERIISAMVREFSLNGYKRASINTIVRSSGISKGSLYQYFNSKEEIFIFVFDQFISLVKKTLNRKAGKTSNKCADREDGYSQLSLVQENNNFDEPTKLKNSLADSTEHFDFWFEVEHVLRAGLKFIDKYPEYFNLYLLVLFEYDVPKREELIAQVRLFSKEYFAPLIEEGRQLGVLNREIPAEMFIFTIDAVLDRFLQGYARPYHDGGMGLAKMANEQLDKCVDMLMQVLKNGLASRN